MFRRKMLTLVVICLLLFGTTALPSRANELGDAVKQQKNIINQKNQAQGQLKELTYTADKIKAQMAQLETQIAEAQMLLAQKQAAYDEAQKQVLSAQKELDFKQKELEDRRVILGKRVKGIYESGQVSYLELLFHSVDLGDFINRMEYFTILVSNDHQLLADIQSQKEQIAQKTHELQLKRDQAAELRAQAAKVSAELDKAKLQQRVALDQNLKEQQLVFENIARLESEAIAWSERIRKLQAAQAKRNGGFSGSITSWPVSGYYEISSPFGWRIHPITKKQSLHTGMDIVAPTGTQVTAAGAGVVIMSGWNTAYGNMIIIDHGKGISSLYGHLSALNVTEGQSVQANQLIGHVGSTGWSTGPHLHFEVRVGGNPTDPLQYFPN
ncbi:MAG: murein hydrolase activator EnvC family protein [Desulfosporosinus sp.]|jgi:murein DD-endopeptidase MepM/ murein hydrolase activator NlpD